MHQPRTGRKTLLGNSCLADNLHLGGSGDSLVLVHALKGCSLYLS